jgi:ABC-2 type transport system ATP-binding protein
VEPGGDAGDGAGSLLADIGGLTGVRETEQLEDPTVNGWRVRIHVEGEPAPFVAPVAQAVSAAGARLTDVRLGEPNLEDVFIHLTGRALR